MSIEPLGVRVRRTLRLGPAETLEMARRQVDGLVARRITPARTRLALRAARVAPGRAATATYFGVPDGHTLNLQVLLPPDDTPASAELILRRARTEHRVAAVLRAGADGTWHAEATALLGTRPGAIPLGRGGWRLWLELTTASGERHRLPVRQAPAEQTRTGPTVAAPLCPDTGTRFRPVASTLGACRIVVTPGRPSAEVVRLAVDPGRAEISGRFVGAVDATGAVAEFRRVGDGALRARAMAVSGDLFRIELPLAALVPAPGAEDIWEIGVRLAGGRRLLVGRFLHDLQHIRRTLRPYEKPMLVPGGALFHLRLQYTLAGRLNLICTSADPKERA